MIERIGLRFLLMLAAGSAGLTTVSTAAWGQQNLELHKYAQEYWDARMEHFPLEATALGDHRFNDKLQDVSDMGRSGWRGRLGGLLLNVRAIDAAGLSSDDRLTRELLIRELEREQSALDCHLHLLVLNPLDGPQVELPLILVSQPFRNAADYADCARRLGAFRTQVGDHIRNVHMAMSRGWVAPRAVVDLAASQMRALNVRRPEDSPFYEPLRDLEHLTPEDRPEVIKRVTDAIRESVLPAYDQLSSYVDNQYLPRCVKTEGVGSWSDGDKAYARMIRLHTTTDMSADEVHRLGLSEVARIRGEMEKVKKEMAFAGSLDEFIRHMRKSEEQRFKSAAELYQAAERILDRAKPKMRKLFVRVPRADCVMKEIEALRAAAAPSGYYNPPPEDGSRPAYYYINTYAPTERPRFTLEALTYHEAVPGHHLQIALHQESEDLPMFRRHAKFTAFVEGWALYAEKLGYEIGGYDDAASRYGQLTFEMWRACRLVVDTGIHAQGWSREKATEYMKQNTSLAEHDIEAEVDRYFAWPGQALAYKIGELKIVALRKEAEAKLADRFDLRAFHDAVLSAGPMPLDLLEERVRGWIAAEAKE